MALVGYGTGVQLAREARRARATARHPPTVVDARFAKPLDGALLDDLAANHELLVTLEEGVLAGGFGTAVGSTSRRPAPRRPHILRVGLPDRYVTHGKPALLHAEVGFTPERVARRVAERLGVDAAVDPAGQAARRTRRPARPGRAGRGRAGARPVGDVTA